MKLTLFFKKISLVFYTKYKKVIFSSIFFLSFVTAICFLFIQYREVNYHFPLAGRKIILDPGHGGPDGGAVSDSGILEKDITLKIVYYLRDYLAQAGAWIIMTRHTDMDLAGPFDPNKKLRKRKTEDLMARVQMARQNQPDVSLVSVHLNSSPSMQWTGAQVFYSPVKEFNKSLATCVQEELTLNLANTHRLPSQKNDVYILKYSPVPTILVEAGFLSNPTEAKNLSLPSYQKKIAASIYYGLLKYYTKSTV